MHSTNFVRDGHCSVVTEKFVFQETKTEWEGAGTKLKQSIENAWLNVLWKGHLINLNELDGFHSNTGMVVLATTNHPEKLDSSILDRPSRFDRKYYFQLPAEAERQAYVDKWNRELQPEMRVTEKGATRLVCETQNFSFAYLKELLVASMVQWVSSGGFRSMDEVILGQTDLLRKQISDSSRK